MAENSVTECGSLADCISIKGLVFLGLKLTQVTPMEAIQTVNKLIKKEMQSTATVKKSPHVHLLTMTMLSI